MTNLWGSTRHMIVRANKPLSFFGCDFVQNTHTAWFTVIYFTFKQVKHNYAIQFLGFHQVVFPFRKYKLFYDGSWWRLDCVAKNDMKLSQMVKHKHAKKKEKKNPLFIYLFIYCANYTVPAGFLFNIHSRDGPLGMTFLDDSFD